ncbi:MAG: hypothetical protein KDI07_21375 [Anaerolineae bacterium]|nr:hypothetical protein [Anaerolineae bacterium]MCB9132001.1 hypothetical protein [Anaerolineales bacterium]MCB0236754.1 hypothetical protein [Anaerolineae bacterium]MCB0238775.1 hypothetical protein [Anaerolineae bacterium]MCB0251137.1 hypothetical protein [Anaerolineae bacterium]
MRLATITIPDVKVQLSVEQLIAAARQLEPVERAELAKALTDDDLDIELAQLIAELYGQPPVDEISDDDILAEVSAVRQHRS